MCTSTPTITAPTVMTAPTKAVEMDASENVAAARESDIRRRQRALSRLSTMRSGIMEEREPGKTKLGA